MVEIIVTAVALSDYSTDKIMADTAVTQPDLEPVMEERHQAFRSGVKSMRLGGFIKNRGQRQVDLTFDNDADNAERRPPQGKRIL